MKYKLIIILLSCCALGGCYDFRPRVGAPWMQDLLNNGPPGPTNFKIGWKHGCESGMSATANKLQRHFLRFKQDYRLVEDPSYYTAWKTGFNYCQRYVFQYLRRNII